MKEYCQICGTKLETEAEKIEEVCFNCQSSMVQEDDIDMGLGFE